MKATTDRAHEPREIPISLIRGGSLYRAQEKAGLIHPDSWRLERRLPAAIAVAWLPLVILSVMHGGMQDLQALLTDYRVYARVFIAIPLLLVGQIAMERRFRDMGHHFLDASIIRTRDLSRFHEIVQKTRRLRDARLPEIIAIIAVYIQVGLIVESGRFAFASWATDAASGSFTAAGYYSALVTQALFLALMAIVVWKWTIWVVFLWRVSRLDLQVDGTNGDLTAGLGFVGEAPRAFVPTVLAVSAVIGANWRAQVLTGQVALQSLTWPAAVLATITLIIFFLPLTVFTPILVREKRRSIRRYGSIQHLVSLRFRHKWTGQHSEQPARVDRLLDGPDVSSLADLTSAFRNVEEMRTYPFRAHTAIAFLVALALPLIPVLTMQIPLREIIRGLLEAAR